jgi:hypothetical protein
MSARVNTVMVGATWLRLEGAAVRLSEGAEEPLEIPEEL